MFHMLTKEYRVEAVQEILSRAGIFQGVDPARLRRADCQAQHGGGEEFRISRLFH